MFLNLDTHVKVQPLAGVARLPARRARARLRNGTRATAARSGEGREALRPRGGILAAPRERRRVARRLALRTGNPLLWSCSAFSGIASRLCGGPVNGAREVGGWKP